MDSGSPTTTCLQQYSPKPLAHAKKPLCISHVRSRKPCGGAWAREANQRASCRPLALPLKRFKKAPLENMRLGALDWQSQGILQDDRRLIACAVWQPFETHTKCTLHPPNPILTHHAHGPRLPRVSVRPKGPHDQNEHVA